MRRTRSSRAAGLAFYGALSNVQDTITVTDLESGAVQTYENPYGRLASLADTAAF
jgi:hypothetical protein